MCTHCGIGPAATKFVRLPQHSQGKPRREVSPENCGAGPAQENPRDQLRISRRMCSRHDLAQFCASAMSGKRSEIGVLKRWLQRPCTCTRRGIGDHANVDAIASVCRVANEMLLPKRRKRVA